MTPGIRSTLGLLLAVMLLAAFCFPPDAMAYKKLVIEFQPGWCPPGVNSNAVKSMIIANVKSYYSFAGTLFSVATNGTDFHKKLIVNAQAPGNDAGYEPRCVSTGYVYGGTYKSAFANSTNFLNSSAIARAIGIAVAHEAGHHFGAKHNSNPGVMQENPYPTLGDDIITNKSFLGTNQSIMMTYMRSTSRNKTDPGGNKDLECNFAMVFGYHPEDPNIIEKEPYSMEVHAVFTGNANYDFGWLNPYGEFISQVPAGADETDLTFLGDDRVPFAVRDINTDQVFPVGQYGFPTFLIPIDPSQSQVPVVSVPYYAQAQIDMPSLGVTIFLDCLPYSPTNGFLCEEELEPQGGPGLMQWGVAALLMLLAAYAVWKVKSRRSAVPVQ